MKADHSCGFHVQEEVGLKGAKTSSFGLNPYGAIVTDVTITGDHPELRRRIVR